jgi:hypothetical protein
MRQAWCRGGAWLARSVFTRAQFPFAICFTLTVRSAATSTYSESRGNMSRARLHPFGEFSGCPRCGVNPAGTSFLPCGPSIAARAVLQRSSVASRKYVANLFRRWELQLPRNQLKRKGASAPEITLPSLKYFREKTLEGLTQTIVLASRMPFCTARRRPLLDQPDRPCENVIQRWSLHLRDSRVSLRRYRLKVRT